MISKVFRGKNRFLFSLESF